MIIFKHLNTNSTNKLIFKLKKIIIKIINNQFIINKINNISIKVPIIIITYKIIIKIINNFNKTIIIIILIILRIKIKAKIKINLNKIKAKVLLTNKKIWNI